MVNDSLSSTFGALADPTRRAILARLATGEASVTELAAPFSMSLPAVSKHLKVLEKAGLIVRSRDAQWRPCHLDAGRLGDVAGWLEHYRRFWEEGAIPPDGHPGEPRHPESKNRGARNREPWNDELRNDELKNRELRDQEKNAAPQRKAAQDWID